MRSPKNKDHPIDNDVSCANLMLALWVSSLTGIGMLGMDSHVLSAIHDVKNGEPRDPAVSWLILSMIVAVVAIIPTYHLFNRRLPIFSPWIPILLWLLAYVTVFRMHY
jgi:uncharacterized membrane protein YraQ (UPF0718 family)